jgi:hypothetical protein
MQMGMQVSKGTMQPESNQIQEVNILNLNTDNDHEDEDEDYVEGATSDAAINVDSESDFEEGEPEDFMTSPSLSKKPVSDQELQEQIQRKWQDFCVPGRTC